MSEDIYLDGVIVNDEEIPFLSEEYSIPFDIISELIANYRAGKSIKSDAYTGVLKKKVDEFIVCLSREAPQEACDDFAPMEVITYQEVVEGQAEDKADDVAAMIQIVTNPISEHFVIREGGQATLRADNPPTLEQAYKVIDRIFVARETTNKIDDYSTWLLGSITAELEGYFGNEFDVSQVSEISDKAYNTIVTAVGVFKEYNGRKYPLSFSHHKEAYYAKIEKEDKDLLLSKAVELDLSAKDVRSMASIIKRLGNSVIIGLTDKSQIKDLIAACKDATVDYVIYDKESNLWKRTKALMEPQGDLVINLNENTVKTENGVMKIST
jgi:hypothetical protein